MLDAFMFVFFKLDLCRQGINNDGNSRESLQKGTYRYNLPPCSNQFKSSAFTEYISFFTKHAILMRRSTVLNLPL